MIIKKYANSYNKVPKSNQYSETSHDGHHSRYFPILRGDSVRYLEVSLFINIRISNYLN